MNSSRTVRQLYHQSGGLTTNRRSILRSFTNSRLMMLKSEDIRPSAGEDAEVLLSQATQLVDAGKWQLCNSGKGLERPFKFKTFKATWVRSHTCE